MEPEPKRRRIDEPSISPIVKIPLSKLKKKSNDVLEEFCNLMQLRGFVVVTIDEEETLHALKEAQKQAIYFFELLNQEEKQKTKILFDEYQASSSGSNFLTYIRFLGLVGYNSPSNAKELYRIRRGEGQIWPKNPSNFQNTIEKSFLILEGKISILLFKIIKKSYFAPWNLF